MSPNEVYEYYGSGTIINKTLGLSHNAFSEWSKRGLIPLLQQLRLEKLTNGALVANEAHAFKGVESKEIHLPSYRYFDKEHGLCRVISLIFMTGRRTKITYVTDKESSRKMVSFNAENLMQAVDVKDRNQQTVFEGDIVQIDKDKYYTFAHVSNVEALKDLGEFTIVGHIYDGVEYGHKTTNRGRKTRNVRAV